MGATERAGAGGGRHGRRDPEAVAKRWRSVLGDLPGMRFVGEDCDRGLVELAIATDRPAQSDVAIAADRPAPPDVGIATDRAAPGDVEIGGVRFVLEPNLSFWNPTRRIDDRRRAQ
jgi:hypothetical protein